VLELIHVAKEFDLRPVLDDVSLLLQPGTRHILTAENGSGKTTLLSIMAGLARPTRGKVLFAGHPLSSKTRKHLGVVLQMPFLYGDLTGAENLQFYAELYGMVRSKELAQTWLRKIDLVSFADMPVKAYSKGMRQRLSFARALLHRPSLLLLDEPFDGLDAGSRQTFCDLLQKAQDDGAAIFLVTHETLADEVDAVTHTLRYGRLVKRA